MVFHPPKWVPGLARSPPDSIPICEFMLSDHYRCQPLSKSKPPFTCGLTGREYSATEVAHRVEHLASSLAQKLNWRPGEGTEWNRVGAVFALNTIDTMTVIWAIHRLSGIATPANAAYSVSELTHQLKNSGAKALFTCLPLLNVALKAAKEAGISEAHIYILDLPADATVGSPLGQQFKTVNDLIAEGRNLPPVAPLRWEKGQGAKQVALLSYSSGTSGQPKAVMISHRNVISNILQIEAFERNQRKPDEQLNVLGMMPQSHIYGLIVICHSNIFVGNGVVVLPQYNFKWLLDSIQKFKIATLYLVPPVIIKLVKRHASLGSYNLSSVRTVWTGAAPLGREIAEQMKQQWPTWDILQGYGLTETCTLVCSSNPGDAWLGSSGSLLPAMKARLVSPEMEEITALDTPGELYIYSPSNALGYLNNEAATNESFPDRWMRTGDVAMFCKALSGHEHIFIVDRLKELIKVKGHQVAPAELEAHLLEHPDVMDAAVVQVLDEAAGELPKAFVVTSVPTPDQKLRDDIYRHVAEHKAPYKRLDGGIEFIKEIPKTASGKILRRTLRDLEAAKRNSKVISKL